MNDVAPSAGAAAPAPSPAPAAPAPAPAAAPAPAPAGDDPAVAAARAFNFDPFPADDWRERFREQGEGPSTGQSADQGGTPPADQQQTTTQAPQPDAATTLLERIAAAAERTATVAPPSQPTRQEPGQQQDPFADIPQYNLRIPDQWLQALGSEDPQQRNAAMHMVVNAIGRHTHMQAVNHIRNEFARVMPHLFRHYLGEFQSTQNVSTSFYSTNPDLDRDELRPLVVRAAELEMAQTGVTQWSPQLAAAIAARVRGVLGSVGGQPAQPAQPTQPPAPPRLSPSGARPGNSGGNAIMEALGM